MTGRGNTNVDKFHKKFQGESWSVEKRDAQAAQNSALYGQIITQFGSLSMRMQDKLMLVLTSMTAASHQTEHSPRKNAARSHGSQDSDSGEVQRRQKSDVHKPLGSQDPDTSGVTRRRKPDACTTEAQDRHVVSIEATRRSRLNAPKGVNKSTGPIPRSEKSPAMRNPPGFHKLPLFARLNGLTRSERGLGTSRDHLRTRSVLLAAIGRMSLIEGDAEKTFQANFGPVESFDATTENLDKVLSKFPCSTEDDATR
jgi:hypothetical protein